MRQRRRFIVQCWTFTNNVSSVSFDKIVPAKKHQNFRVEVPFLLFSSLCWASKVLRVSINLSKSEIWFSFYFTEYYYPEIQFLYFFVQKVFCFLLKGFLSLSWQLKKYPVQKKCLKFLTTNKMEIVLYVRSSKNIKWNGNKRRKIYTIDRKLKPEIIMLSTFESHELIKANMKWIVIKVLIICAKYVDKVETACWRQNPYKFYKTGQSC